MQKHTIAFVKHFDTKNNDWLNLQNTSLLNIAVSAETYWYYIIHM